VGLQVIRPGGHRLWGLPVYALRPWRPVALVVFSCFFSKLPYLSKTLVLLQGFLGALNSPQVFSRKRRGNRLIPCAVASMPMRNASSPAIRAAASHQPGDEESPLGHSPRLAIALQRQRSVPCRREPGRGHASARDLRTVKRPRRRLNGIGSDSQGGANGMPVRAAGRTGQARQIRLQALEAPGAGQQSRDAPIAPEARNRSGNAERDGRRA